MWSKCYWNELKLLFELSYLSFPSSDTLWQRSFEWYYLLPLSSSSIVNIFLYGSTSYEHSKIIISKIIKFIIQSEWFDQGGLKEEERQLWRSFEISRVPRVGGVCKNEFEISRQFKIICINYIKLFQYHCLQILVVFLIQHGENIHHKKKDY